VAIPYDRSAVPVGSSVRLEVQFKDSAGNSKDAQATPTFEVQDASNAVVLAASATGVTRTAKGRYRYEYTIPTGYVSGIWNDIWVGTVDGYQLTEVFNFTVNSVGSIESTGSSIPEADYTLDDDDLEYDYTQEEIQGILLLRGMLKKRLRSTIYNTEGSSCPIFSNDLLLSFLCASLSELNATPAFTTYSFADNVIQTLAVDLMTQGALLVAWSSQAIIEAGFELTVNDNGVTVNPPPVSTTMTGLYTTQLTEYRAKLKEFKRNHRASARGLSAGNLLNGRNFRVRRLRHRKELRLI